MVLKSGVEDGRYETGVEMGAAKRNGKARV